MRQSRVVVCNSILVHLVHRIPAPEGSRETSALRAVDCRYKDNDFFGQVVFIDMAAKKSVRIGISYTVLCGKADLPVLYDGRREGLRAMLAANACIIAIVVRRCIAVTWMIQSSHCSFIASWLAVSRLGSEDGVLDTCQLSYTYSKRSTLTMKLSSPPSNS
jgi:hypothetical protein